MSFGSWERIEIPRAGEYFIHKKEVLVVPIFFLQ